MKSGIFTLSHLKLLKLIFLLPIASLVLLRCLFAADTSSSCKNEILNAKIDLILSPEETFTEDFILSFNDTQILFLVKDFDRDLLTLENGYSFTEWFPKKQDRFISSEEGKDTLSQWEVSAKNEEGVQLEVMGKTTKIKKESYCLYTIKDSNWERIKWEEGKQLFAEWTQKKHIKTITITPKGAMNRSSKVMIKDNALWKIEKDSNGPSLQLTAVFKNGITEFVESPDGTKVIYIPILGKKPASIAPFAPPMGEYQEFGLGVCCLEGNADRLFKINNFLGMLTRGRPFLHPPQWASDGSFVLIFDDSGEHALSKNNKLYLLRFR